MSGKAPSSAFDDRCFGRQYRVLAAPEYAVIFAARSVLRGTWFVLHYRRSGGLSARLGLVIPKKQARCSVLRNAIKRQARELFRSRRKELPAADLVLRLAQPMDRPKRPALAKDKEKRNAWRTDISALFDQLCRKVAT